MPCSTTSHAANFFFYMVQGTKILDVAACIYNPNILLAVCLLLICSQSSYFENNNKKERRKLTPNKKKILRNYQQQCREHYFSGYIYTKNLVTISITIESKSIGLKETIHLKQTGKIRSCTSKKKISLVKFNKLSLTHIIPSIFSLS